MGACSVALLQNMPCIIGNGRSALRDVKYMHLNSYGIALNSTSQAINIILGVSYRMILVFINALPVFAVGELRI